MQLVSFLDIRRHFLPKAADGCYVTRTGSIACHLPREGDIDLLPRKNTWSKASCAMNGKTCPLILSTRCIFTSGYSTLYMGPVSTRLLEPNRLKTWRLNPRCHYSQTSSLSFKSSSEAEVEIVYASSFMDRIYPPISMKTARCRIRNTSTG